MKTHGVDVYDVLAIAGFTALVYGILLWWAPAAWMVGGLLVLSAALWPSLRKKAR